MRSKLFFIIILAIVASSVSVAAEPRFAYSDADGTIMTDQAVTTYCNGVEGNAFLSTGERYYNADFGKYVYRITPMSGFGSSHSLSYQWSEPGTYYINCVDAVWDTSSQRTRYEIGLPLRITVVEEQDTYVQPDPESAVGIIRVYGGDRIYDARFRVREEGSYSHFYDEYRVPDSIQLTQGETYEFVVNADGFAEERVTKTFTQSRDYVYIWLNSDGYEPYP